MAVKEKRSDTRGLWLRNEIYWLDASIQGKRVRMSLNTADLSEAIIAARKIKTNPAGLADTSLAAYLAVLEQRGISRNRRDMVRTTIPFVLDACGTPEITKLNSTKLQKWLDGHLNPSTARDYLRIVSLYCRWLLDHGKIRINPCADLRLPKLPPARRQSFLTPEQARRCIEECEDPSLKFCLFAGLHAGLRKAEVIACRPRWFDLRAGLLHVQNEDDFTVKDRDNRTIPLTAEFSAFLKEFGLHEPFMLKPETTQGKARYRYDFKKSFMAHMAKVGLKEFTFHDLRRTFASLLVSSGVSPYKVAKWLGDGIGVVEKHYGHLLPNDADINRSWTKSAGEQSTRRE